MSINRGRDKDMVHIHMECYSAVKKNEIMSLTATQMDLQIVILSEVREGKLSYDIPYMWNLKRNDTNERDSQT